jgi:hypothetical protein
MATIAVQIAANSSPEIANFSRGTNVYETLLFILFCGCSPLRLRHIERCADGHNHARNDYQSNNKDADTYDDNLVGSQFDNYADNHANIYANNYSDDHATC